MILLTTSKLQLTPAYAKLIWVLGRPQIVGNYQIITFILKSMHLQNLILCFAGPYQWDMNWHHFSVLIKRYLFIIWVKRKTISEIEAGDKWIRLDWLRERVKTAQNANHRWPENTRNIHYTLFTVALLWPAASLPCCLTDLRKPCVLTKRRIRAVYCILYTAVIFALLMLNNCQSLPATGTVGRNVYAPTSREKEKEFDGEEYVILTPDLAIQQRIERMDELYCYLMEVAYLPTICSS